MLPPVYACFSKPWKIDYLVHASYDSERHFSKQSNFREAYFLDSWFGDESGVKGTLGLPWNTASLQPQGLRLPPVGSRLWDR